MVNRWRRSRTSQTLHCMEIWGGIEPVERTVSTPGLDLWVFSRPFRRRPARGRCLLRDALRRRRDHADRGRRRLGTRVFGRRVLVVAPVALRKNINQKSQKRLVEKLNRQFTEMAGMRRFATALVITYLASHDRLSVCNAGHPRPLYYRAGDEPGRCCRSGEPAKRRAATCRWGSTKRRATRRST